MTKRVAILQSNYIPWKGYFDLIHDVDLFVYYDDVQYTVRDWRNRNQIKTPNGMLWLSVPVGADRNRFICDVKVSNSEWQEKHLNSIVQFYKKTKYFELYENYFKGIYLNQTWTELSKLNQSLIHHIARDFLGIETKFINSSEISKQGHKQEAILDILTKVSATSYVSGPAAKDYLNPQSFEKLGIELIWKDYSGYPEYPQYHQPFRHDVSILDLLCHVGPDAPEYIWGWRSSTSVIQ